MPNYSNAKKEHQQMYLQNKYTRWYYSIINRAQSRNTTGYTERHHIIPRSLGGKDDLSNLVNLTGREHFICHWLLTKMVVGKDREKMIYALRMMTVISSDHSDRYYNQFTSRVFEHYRAEHAKIHSTTMTGKPSWNKGLTLGPQSKEHRLKNSIGNKGKRTGVAPGNKGKPQPEYIKDKKRKPKPMVSCLGCRKTGGVSAMTRWHLDTICHREKS